MKYQLTQTIYSLDNYIEHSGGEYGNKRWKDSAIIKYLNDHSAQGSEYTYYSNVPEAVYIFTNIKTKWSPPKTYYNSPRRITSSTSMNSILRGDNKSYLIWFNTIDRKYLFTVEELKYYTSMIKIAQLPDGEIYSIAKK